MIHYMNARKLTILFVTLIYLELMKAMARSYCTTTVSVKDFTIL